MIFNRKMIINVPPVSVTKPVALRSCLFIGELAVLEAESTGLTSLETQVLSAAFLNIQISWRKEIWN